MRVFDVFVLIAFAAALLSHPGSAARARRNKKKKNSCSMKFARYSKCAQSPNCCDKPFVCVDGTCDTKKKILMLGNSFTIKNKMYETLEEFVSHDSILETKLKGSTSLNWHSRYSMDSVHKRPDWDFVIMQEQSAQLSFSDAWSVQRSWPYAMKLHQEIASRQGLTILYQTWGYKGGNPSFFHKTDNYFDMQDRISDQYAKLAEYLRNAGPVRIAPVGEVWRIAYRSGNPSLLYDDDARHPSQLGSYLAAVVIYRTMEPDEFPSLNMRPRGVSKREAKLVRQWILKYEQQQQQ